MGVYKYLKKNVASVSKEDRKDKLVLWRREPVTNRIDYPSRLDRAHAVGYRAKDGMFLVRQRVSRGGHTRPDISGGRHSHNMGIRLNLRKNYRHIAEERCQDAFPNCEVLNSYFADNDGKHYWFEIVMVDKQHPQTLADPRTSWIAEPQHKGRVYRGLTSAGRKTRGLRHKGTGSEKARPSRRAHSRRR